MPFIFKTGDMFNCKAEAIVNTVNCVGVMGKGVALEFKKRWPANFKEYKRMCDKGLIQPGKMMVFKNYDLLSPSETLVPHKYLVNFPTKIHWRSKSKIEHVEMGLDDLKIKLGKLDISSICIPPLGCGNGGLDWEDVKPLILEKLESESFTRNIFIYEPKAKKSRPEFSEFNVHMNASRAILIKTLGEFEEFFFEGYSNLSLQKIVYFLEQYGVDYNVKFEKNIYGPYSSSLARALVRLKEVGVLHGASSLTETVYVNSSAFAAASEFISDTMQSKADEIVRSLSLLIDGFESPYGLELLSSVHFIAKNDNNRNFEDVFSSFSMWSERKNRMFPRDAVKVAYDRLSTDGLI